MSPNFIDLTRQTFGRLRVDKRAEKGSRGEAKWVCTCSCRFASTVDGHTLRRGRASCGCLQRERTALAARANTTHGHSRRDKQSPTYRSWCGMLTRVTNPNHKSFSTYGGHGVEVCERWHWFENFLADKGIRPKGTALGRFCDRGDYTPENTAWMTPAEQGLARQKQSCLREIQCDARRSGRQKCCLASMTPFFIRNVKKNGHQVGTIQLNHSVQTTENMEPTSGLEPLTCRLRIGCSTN
jgi:hypothetical protein